jgi:AcrR family transcriptional regulator
MSPPRNAAVTRDRLLACAGRRFLQESYENVGLRDIAGDAGVDVALVGRYFGSKEQLFREVLRKDGDWDALAKADDLPALLADLAAESDPTSDAGHIERLLIMLRSASSPQASALIRSAFDEDVLGPLAALLSGPQPQMRAAMAMSVLMGTTIMRTIMKLDVLHQCDSCTFNARLKTLLTSALSED